MASLWFTWTFDVRTAGMGAFRNDRQRKTNNVPSTPLPKSVRKDSGPGLGKADVVTPRADLMNARTYPVSAAAGPVSDRNGPITSKTHPSISTLDPTTDPAVKDDPAAAKGYPQTTGSDPLPGRMYKADPVTTSTEVSKTSAQTTVSSEDILSEAVKFLGLLRHNEDELTERMKVLMKRDRRLVQLLFSVLVEEWTPLHACTLKGARKLVKLALKCGVSADLEMGAPEGLPGRCTPLHLAAYRGDVSLLQVLVQGGATISKKDGTHRTPLFYAANKRNTLAARKLIKYGADLEDLTPEQRQFYKGDIERRPASLLCIPVQSDSGNR